MPHDSHTTHEPDSVGRESDRFGQDDTIDRQTTLLMFGGFDETSGFGAHPGELAPTTN